MLTKRTLDKASFIEEVTIHKKTLSAIRDFKNKKSFEQSTMQYGIRAVILEKKSYREMFNFES